MKKRLICMLLSVLMIVSLFVGTSVSANAETVSYSTMTYRMASGDYVLRICQRLGLNYYVCKTAIMKLNNINNDDQWRHLPVGKLLTLPSTDADAVVITTGHGSTAKTTTTTTSSVVTSTVAAATPSSNAKTTATASGDTIWFWIVPYQLRSGETIADAMNALGMSASQYWDTIQKINKIKDWGSSKTSSSILLPTVYPPASGFSRVTVYAHRMLANETPANVVAARGLDYNKIKSMLDILNEKYGGVANVKTGQNLFYPIASNGKVYGNDTAAGSYKLISGLSDADGVVEFYVNGKRVYEAKPGETVTYALKPASGKAVKDVVLKYANGQADLYLKGSSFTMPSCDVRLDASFQSGHKIALQVNYDGKAAARVDGVGVSSAAKGAPVMVVSTDPSLEIDELYVNYIAYDGAKREKVTSVDNGFVMPDYDVTVEVVLKPVRTYALYFQTAVRADGTNLDADSGSYTLQVDGTDVTKAARGSQVKIVAKPYQGYTVQNVQLRRRDGGAAPGLFDNTFTMPPSDLDVIVTFAPKANNIVMNPVEGGRFLAQIADPNNPGQMIQTDEATTNSQVFITWDAAAALPGYAASTAPVNAADNPLQARDYIVTRNSDGLRVPVFIDNAGRVWFRMPTGGVTVTGGVTGNTWNYTAVLFLDGQQIQRVDPNVPNYMGVSLYAQGDNSSNNNGVNSRVRAEFQDDNPNNPGTPVAPSTIANNPVQADLGEYIKLSYKGGSHISLSRYEIVNRATNQIDTELTNEARLNGCFQMPNNNVLIRAYFASKAVKLEGKDIKVKGSGTVGMLDATTLDSVDGVSVGDPFVLSLSPSEGYTFNTAPADGKSRLLVTRKDNGGELLPVGAPVVDPNTGEVRVSFAEMPECGINVEVTFDKAQFQLLLTALDEWSNPLTGGGFWKVVVNGKETIVENLTSTVMAEYGDTVSIDLTEAGASKYTYAWSMLNNRISKDKSFRIIGTDAMNPQIPVTIVLKPKEVSNTKNPFFLKPVINDAARGNVGFLILASDTGYSTPNPNNYVTHAYAGDTVAIVPTAMNGYYTDVYHINAIIDSSHKIRPTPQTISTAEGDKLVYTFVVPKEGITSIDVTFLPIGYALTFTKSPATAADGLFKVTYSDGAENNDVLVDDTFKAAAYGGTVKVTLTEAGKKAGAKITSLSGLPAGVTTKAITDGFSFTMPAQDCNVTVNLQNAPTAPVPPTPVEVTLPKATTETGYNLLYYKADGVTAITDYKAMSDETVIVKLDNDPPPGKKLKDGIHFYDASGNEVTSTDNGGSLKVLETISGAKPAGITFTDKQYAVRLHIKNAPATANVTVTANSATVPLTEGLTLEPNLAYGSTLTIKTDTGKIISVDNLTQTSNDGTTYVGTLTPADTVNDGETVDVTVNFQKTYKMMVNLVNAEAGDSVKVEGTEISASGTMVAYDHFVDTDTVNFTAATRDIKSVEGLKSYTPIDTKNGTGYMQAYETDTVTVTVTFKPAPCVLLGSSGVKYFKNEACAAADEVTGTAEKGYTVYVKVDPLANDEYVKSVTITDADGKVTKLIGDAQAYTMAADITNVEVETAKKLVKVKLVVTGGPDSAECKISTDKTNWMPAQLSNLKSGDPVYIQAAFAKISSVSETTGAFGTSLSKDNDTEASGTLNLPATAKNGDTITINVVLVDPD